MACSKCTLSFYGPWPCPSHQLLSRENKMSMWLSWPYNLTPVSGATFSLSLSLSLSPSLSLSLSLYIYIYRERERERERERVSAIRLSGSLIYISASRIRWTFTISYPGRALGVTLSTVELQMHALFATQSIYLHKRVFILLSSWEIGQWTHSSFVERSIFVLNVQKVCFCLWNFRKGLAGSKYIYIYIYITHRHKRIPTQPRPHKEATQSRSGP